MDAKLCARKTGGVGRRKGVGRRSREGGPPAPSSLLGTSLGCFHSSPPLPPGPCLSPGILTRVHNQVQGRVCGQAGVVGREHRGQHSSCCTSLPSSALSLPFSRPHRSVRCFQPKHGEETGPEVVRVDSRRPWEPDVCNMKAGALGRTGTLPFQLSPFSNP